MDAGEPRTMPPGSPRGLTAAEVEERRERDGYNELPTGEKHVLLVVCGGISAALGDRQEAFMLLGFVLFIMALTLLQERKTERALESLRDLASPRALVIR